MCWKDLKDVLLTSQWQKPEDTFRSLFWQQEVDLHDIRQAVFADVVVDRCILDPVGWHHACQCEYVCGCCSNDNCFGKH